MDIIVKYDQYEKQITKVENYKELVKGVCQSFKYILKNNFTLHYFDEEGDKITLSNQEDFEAVQVIEIFICRMQNQLKFLLKQMVKNFR